ncbi:MAG TPA: HEAT repeat domain-containing protein [Gemmatimonadaceae bacterium]|nr:HEAT repeat domain-containing protein [Gemmatimonadaceae bacterium]
MTSPTAALSEKEAGRPEPPFPPALVEEMLRLLVKAVRAHQLYLHNNPTYIRALDLLRGAFAPLWQQTEELAIQITETAFMWEGRPVLEDVEKSADSLPWLFYKDGVRELRLLRGVEQEELVKLLGIVQRVRHASPEEDDLLTMLWEADFLFIRYRYVDLAVEQAAPVDASVSSEARPEQVSAEVREEDIQEAREGVVRLDEFDATLYFLDEREIEYLRGAVEQEYAADLRRNVVTMLLDVFELQGDRTVREEICGIVENLMLHLLSANQFSSVAYMLREVRASTERARSLEPAQRDRLNTLPDRLSNPEALSQLLQAMDEASELPPQEDLTQLFEQLRAMALATVLSWLSRGQNARLRPMLETAAGRLASANTSELVRLIGSNDHAVALEACRRAGALKTAAAVNPLSKLLSDGDAQLRLASVQALSEIGSPGALQALERGVDDPERDVRVATARALAARQHRPALSRVEGAIKGKVVREADLTEKMAMFEAYGALSGDAGITLLDGLLNGKTFLGRREDPELRACAAMALGRIGTPRAQESLRKAASEKEVLVRNAVNRALRGGAA